MALEGLEAFIRTAGSVMGLAQESFLLNVDAGGGLTSTLAPSATLNGAVSGSGQAALAANSESTAIDAQGSALGAQNLAVNAHLDSTLMAAGAGHGQMGSVIEGTLADVNSLAAATITPAGQLALVQAVTARLEQTWQALTNGHADASTRAASSAQLTAAFNGLANNPLGGLAQTSSAAFTGAASPMTGMSSMPMLAAASMAANAAAMSGAQAANTQQSGSDIQHVGAVQNQNPDQSKIQAVLNRALAQLGVPYVWGGETPRGPNTKGGFDCSGLVKYAYAPYITLPRMSQDQFNVGTPVSRSNVQAGDLIFMNWDEQSGVPGYGHVMMAISHTQAVQASQPGQPIGTTPIPTSGVVIKRILGAAGGSGATAT